MFTFSYIAKSLLLASLQGPPWSTVKTFFNGLQNAVMSTTSLDLGDPKTLPNANGYKSGKRLSAIESLPESNCVTSVRLIDQYHRKNGIMKWLAKRRPESTPERAAKRPKWAEEHKNWIAEEFEGLFGTMNAPGGSQMMHTKSGFSERG